ncbi:unnamed protein product [Linum tenue]|uniref:Uncharacterized protein n=1 Tax=Linum tenue TaxID=586396 RepID=A0AAV0RUD6_9ROSI|nr:unnamed protein product [Linum tenue]
MESMMDPIQPLMAVKFQNGLQKGGIHSGHVQTSPGDSFCIVKNDKGKIQDDYTKDTAGPDSVQVLVATRAKASGEPSSMFY